MCVWIFFVIAMFSFFVERKATFHFNKINELNNLYVDTVWMLSTEFWILRSQKIDITIFKLDIFTYFMPGQVKGKSPYPKDKASKKS